MLVPEMEGQNPGLQSAKVMGMDGGVGQAAPLTTQPLVQILGGGSKVPLASRLGGTTCPLRNA